MSTSYIVHAGYRFLPTDEELISYYLLGKSSGSELQPINVLVEKNLYGLNANPWDVLRDVNWDTSVTCNERNGINNVKKTIYVFTKLSKTKNRVARRAGVGTWDGQASGRRIKSGNGEFIGLLKTFSYQLPENLERTDRWTMHEFSLAGVSLKYELKDKDVVLCRINRCYKDKIIEPPREIGRLDSMMENSGELTCKGKRSRTDEAMTENPLNKKGKASLEVMNFSSPQKEAEIVMGYDDDPYDLIMEALDNDSTPISSPAHVPDQVVEEEFSSAVPTDGSLAPVQGSCEEATAAGSLDVDDDFYFSVDALFGVHEENELDEPFHFQQMHELSSQTVSVLP